MKRFFFSCAAALCLAAGITSCSSAEDINLNKEIESSKTAIGPQGTEGDIIPDQYIVELKSSAISSARERLDPSLLNDRRAKGEAMEQLNAVVEAELDQWLAAFDLTEDQIIAKYTAGMVGVALKLTKDQYDQIRRNSDVYLIEHDRMEQIPPFEVESVEYSASRAQTTPCGITNAGGSGTVSTGRWIWIVDTGIDLDHPDLNVQTSSTFAKSFVGGTADDCNGHGTHCAGIAAAVNNTIGVIGVSAGATVVPVRVFGCTGGSPTSTILNGLNHVATYDGAGDVTNLSLSGNYGSGCSTGSSYKTVLTTLANATNRVAMAAGNDASSATTYQPACLNGSNRFTVASMTCSKGWSSFSNFGRPPVDWIATGSSVYSTYKNGGYATLSGTSMATPHVAGIMHFRNAAPLNGGSVSYGGLSYPIAKK